jgi:hypothetical protein
MTSEEKKRWLVVLAGPARKSLKRLSSHEHARIRAAIDEMEMNPLQGDIRKLQGHRHGFPVGSVIGAFSLTFIRTKGGSW